MQERLAFSVVGDDLCILGGYTSQLLELWLFRVHRDTRVFTGVFGALAVEKRERTTMSGQFVRPNK